MLMRLLQWWFSNRVRQVAFEPASPYNICCRRRRRLRLREIDHAGEKRRGKGR